MMSARFLIREGFRGLFKCTDSGSSRVAVNSGLERLNWIASLTETPLTVVANNNLATKPSPEFGTL